MPKQLGSLQPILSKGYCVMQPAAVSIEERKTQQLAGVVVSAKKCILYSFYSHNTLFKFQNDAKNRRFLHDFRFKMLINMDIMYPHWFCNMCFSPIIIY